MKKEPCKNFYGDLVRFHEAIKLISFEFTIRDVIPASVQNVSLLSFFAFFVILWRKKPPIKCYGVFNHSLQTYEVAKFWMIKLCLDVSNVIHANEHTKNANCGLRVSLWTYLLIIMELPCSAKFVILASGPL